jgi:mono/diheme cytochrome c family protein
MKPVPRQAILLSALLWATAAVSLHAQEPAAPPPPAEHPGKVIWEKYCVDCHGKNGEGVKDEYDDPLHGDRSLTSLAKRIDKTMPEDKEEELNAEQSAQVADYIYNAFYSPQSRGEAPPIHPAFSRLTVSQFRNSVADLFGGPDFQRAWTDERGLAAKYTSKGVTALQGMGGGNDFQRKDNQIDFHFGAASPEPQILPAEEFSIRWDGSLIVEETGVYEFVLKTENGARLYVNNWRDPLIDAWVTVGPDVREEKASLFLIGGRVYPLRVEHFKFKEKSSSIELLWKAPNGVLETIPQRNLFPYETRETIVVANPFPADDSSDGYPRGTSISKAWFDAITAAAGDAAKTVSERLETYMWTKKDEPDRAGKLKEYCRKLASTAFRRPISDEENASLIDSRFASADKPETAVRRVILAILTSPRFLYPSLMDDEKPSDQEIAARLSLALWDSVPDKELLNQAAAGKLKTAGQITQQANRMLGDPRAREKLHGFFAQWLNLKDISAIAKDPAVYPDLNESILADLRRSLGIFIDDIVWTDASDYRQLLSADYLPLNDRLAKFYQQPPVGGNDFKHVTLPDGQRAGLLTHPYLLTSLSYFKDTSPIHRGVFLTRAIVGRALKPPPQAVEFKDGHFDPSLTMREKVTDITKSATCMGCHAEINPLGFALENYDAVGRWRTIDNKKPINTTSDYPDDSGNPIKIATPQDVANFAIHSDTSKKTFVKQLFQHTNKQPVAAYGSGTLDKLSKDFADHDFNVKQLLVESAVIAASQGLPHAKPTKETAAK